MAHFRLPTLLTALSMAALLGCNSNDKTTNPGPVPRLVSILVTKQASPMFVGSSFGFEVQVKGVDDTRVQWSSSEPTVASVSADGLVTAKAPGATIITATLVAAPAKQATTSVLVTTPPTQP